MENHRFGERAAEALEPAGRFEPEQRGRRELKQLVTRIAGKPKRDGIRVEKLIGFRVEQEQSVPALLK